MFMLLLILFMLLFAVVVVFACFVKVQALSTVDPICFRKTLNSC